MKMKAIKEIVYKLELNEDELRSIKDCLEVFLNDGLNELIKGRIGIAKLNSSQLITLNEVNDYLEAID